MQQLLQKCRLVNHNEETVIRFCSFHNCLLSRFLCSICLEQNLHSHAQENFNHIVDPALFKTKVDVRVKELEKMLSLYQHLERKITNIQDILGTKQDQLQTQLKKEQQRLIYLISQTDIQNISVTMISERNIQYGSRLIQQNINHRHNVFFRAASKYYENIKNFIQQLDSQLLQIQQITQKLEEDKILTSKYVKTIVQNLTVPLYTYKISRDELYFVFTNCIKELQIYDIKQNNIIVQYTGMKNQVTSILFFENDKNLILGDTEGILYLFKFDKYKREIIEQQQMNLQNTKIIQMFDMAKQYEFIIFCSNGRIQIIDIFEGQIVKQFQVEYDMYSIMDYQQTLQILIYPINGFINLYQIQNFDLILRKQHEYKLNTAYRAVFSLKGSQLALFSQHIQFLEIYSFVQKPQINSSLQKRIQHQCINIQWVMNDDCIVIQMAENTKILKSSNLEDIKTIQTETINLNQCFESQQMSFLQCQFHKIIIDFELYRIVRYDN